MFASNYLAKVATLRSLSKLWAGTQCSSSKLARTIMSTSLDQAAPAAPRSPSNPEETSPPYPKEKKLHGRAFYESIGSPKFILAPMVDQSEFAWRLLSRSFLPSTSPTTPPLLAYTPMLHSRLFSETCKFRDMHFLPLRSSLTNPQPLSPHPYTTSAPYLDGNPQLDRPLIVQFCANDPTTLLSAARYVQPFCDAIDLNLGCPQGIARKGRYGAFLQEDIELIEAMIMTLHENLEIPVTAKIRVLATKEETLRYAKRIVAAGASILTVHGRTRDMKGHKTGLADWGTIRFLRDKLPRETVLFANGNVLQHEDLEECLRETGVDGVMSAEGNLCDPVIFAEPPREEEQGRMHWKGVDGRVGWRVDEVFRRYMDIIYRYVLEIEPPVRNPLSQPLDHPHPATSSPPIPTPITIVTPAIEAALNNKRKQPEAPPQPSSKNKKQKQTNKNKRERPTNPSLLAMQAHLFHLLRPLVSRHTDIRDKLAKSRAGDMQAFEDVLAMVEKAVTDGIRAYAETEGRSWEVEERALEQKLVKSLVMANRDDEKGEGMMVGKAQADSIAEHEDKDENLESSVETVRRCRRPWWVVQPYVRPLPKEALAKGSWTLNKKESSRAKEELMTDTRRRKEGNMTKVGSSSKRDSEVMVDKLMKDGVGGQAEILEGFVEKQPLGNDNGNDNGREVEVEVPRQGLVCG